MYGFYPMIHPSDYCGTAYFSCGSAWLPFLRSHFHSYWKITDDICEQELYLWITYGICELAGVAFVNWLGWHLWTGWGGICELAGVAFVNWLGWHLWARVTVVNGLGWHLWIRVTFVQKVDICECNKPLSVACYKSHHRKIY